MESYGIILDHMGTKERFIRSNMVSKKIGDLEISKFFVGREKKGQAAISPLVLLRGRGGRAKLERKDFPGGQVKRVRSGRIGVEGLPDFRRGLGFISP